MTWKSGILLPHSLRVKPSFLIISLDLTCSFLLEEKWLPPLGGSPQQPEASGGPEQGLGERRHGFDGLPLGPCHGFLSARSRFDLCSFCLEPSATIVAQGSSGQQESTRNADTSAPGLLRRCALFHLLPTERVLEDWIFTSSFLVLSDSFYPFTETLLVIKYILA